MAKKHKAIVALSVLHFEVALKKWKQKNREAESAEAEHRTLLAARERVELAKTRLAEVKAALCGELELDPEKTSLAFLEGKPVLEVWSDPQKTKGVEHEIADEDYREVATNAYHELRVAKDRLGEAEQRKADREKQPTSAAAEFHAFVLPLVQREHPEAPADAKIELHPADKRLAVSWVE